MRYYIEHLPMTIPMGVQSENNAEAVEFDVSDWLARDGSLSFSVWVTRPGETEAYQAANATLKDGVLYWWPTSADTAIAGEGRVEILAVSANRRMLSGWTATSIRETTTETTTDAPVDQRPWLDQALLASEEAKAAATSAAASADQAEGVVKKEIATLTEDIARNTAPPIVPTATGSIVTITDGAARPAVEAVSHIAPVQSGSGEASPSNVRAISGWNGVAVYRANNNLFSGWVHGEWIDPSHGGTSVYWGLGGRSQFISVKPGEKYTLSGLDDTLNSLIAFYDRNKQYMSRTAASAGRARTETVPDGCYYVMFSHYIVSNSTSTSTELPSNVQFEKGDTATPYVPYQGQTLSASLPETVYGGTLDWTTGVLTVEWVIDSVDGSDDENWRMEISEQQGIRFIYKPANAFDCGEYENDQTAKICSHAVASTNAGHTFDAINAFSVYAGGNIFINLNKTTTLADFKALLAAEAAKGTPVQFAWKIATPYTLQLTPQQLDTLKGVNNVWSDCGDTTLSYIADTKSYIDQKLAAIAAATL